MVGGVLLSAQPVTQLQNIIDWIKKNWMIIVLGVVVLFVLLILLKPRRRRIIIE